MTALELGLTLPTLFFFVFVFVFFFSLQKNHRPKYVSCIAFTKNGDVITGDTDGAITVWPEGLCCPKTVLN